MRLLRRSLILLSVTAATFACGFAGAENGASPRKAIEEATRKFLEAFNSGDAKAMSAFWTEDGDFVGENGDRFRFRDQLAAKISGEVAKDAPKDRPSLAMVVENVRFVTPQVVTADGLSIFKSGAGPPATHGRFTATWVLRDKRWLLDSVRENIVTGGMHHSHLMELEWMIGDWIEAGKDPRLESQIRWSADGNFIERAFKSNLPGRGVQTGVQRIGWDPKRKQFRSWTFNSDGGFTHGLWSRAANGWTAEISGVSSDGRSTGSLTQIARVDDNKIELESTESTIEGEPLPDIKLQLVRKPKQ